MMRRWIIYALAALLALSVFGWIFYIPSEALCALKPVPAHAQLIYRGETPGQFLSFFPLLGRTGSDDPGRWRKSFQMLENSPLTVATVPLGGRDRRDSWIAVSTIGPRAFLLRWQLALFPPEGIKTARSYGAWPVWQYSDPSLPPWMRVRFSITEGLLICSISDDSHDIYYLLDTLDGRRPSAERKER
ncbi:MAG TPA: hypothetical protein PLD51_00295 [Pontiellaceae bacterium]|nr:hypothetical protein [Pontiellaceae bacterium]HPR82271.1 hypothetical protein [Pontiellaceae bacterium]